MSRRNSNTVLVRDRRAAAIAAGYCRTCCTAKPVQGLKSCAWCIEIQRAWRASRSGRVYRPVYKVAPRRPAQHRPRFTVHAQKPLPVAPAFDIAADRREEWIALSELSALHRVGGLRCE